HTHPNHNHFPKRRSSDLKPPAWKLSTTLPPRPDILNTANSTSTSSCALRIDIMRIDDSAAPHRSCSAGWLTARFWISIDLPDFEIGRAHGLNSSHVKISY